MGEVILVQPKTGRWDYVGVRPPDALLSIAAVPFQKGYKIKIIDQRTDKDWKIHIKQHLSSAICVGVTSMTGPQINGALEVARFVKENSDVPVVWGGVHASLLPEQTIRNKHIDVVVRREGDYAFYDVIKALEKGKDSLKKVKGIYYKDKEGNIKKTPERELIRNLDGLPMLPYELINLKNYFGFDIANGKSITLMTSRGCPFHCSFCYNTVYYKNTWRGMSAERTIERIKYVRDKFKINSIYFQDDNFCANLGRFEKIVDGILKEKIGITWGLLGARMDSLKIMNPEFLRKVVKAGCVNIDVGIESGSQRVLNMISKGVKIQDVLNVNKKLAKFFTRTKYTFIMGIPTETEKELLQSVRLSTKLSKDNKHVLPLFFTYSAYPGTKLYDIAVKHGFKEPKSLEEWSEINYDQAYLHYPWINKKRIKMLENLEFTSLLASKNIDYKISKKYMKFLVSLYRPIAKYRFENNFHHFLLERRIVNLISKLK